jgi:hypothetical protein
MTRNDKSPEEFTPRETDVSQDQTLAEIEQRLRRARPRCPAYDADRIVALAGDADPSVTLAPRRGPGPGKGSARWLGVIAGSWICGAIAGSLLTVVIWQQDAAPEVGSATETSVAENGAAVREPRSDGNAREATVPAASSRPPQSIPSWSRSESLISTVLLDPYGPPSAAYGRSAPALTPGKIARHKLESGRWLDPFACGSTPAGWTGSPNSSIEALGDTAPAATPAITREQLLQDLLGADTGSIL